MGVDNRGQDDRNKAVLDNCDHPVTPANFSEKYKKVNQEKNTARDTGKMCAFRLIDKLGWTDVFKLLELNTVVQCGDKDGLIQLNPQ